jgi:hypothetical protein
LSYLPKVTQIQSKPRPEFTQKSVWDERARNDELLDEKLNSEKEERGRVSQFGLLRATSERPPV